MAVSGERMTYEGPSGAVTAYLAKPEGSGPWPGLIVIQEVFGLVPHIEDMARRFAEQGYLALAPDMYSHDQLFKNVNPQGVVPAMMLRREADPAKALEAMPAEQRSIVAPAWEWLTKRDQSTYIPDLKAAVDWLKARPDCTGAVGSIGYCMGGGLSGQLAAAGADINAAVIYYGGIPPVDQVPNVKCAVQGHYGGDDPGITNTVPQLQAAMAANGKDFTAYVYEGAPHAFNNDTRDSYHADASKLAWERTNEFLAKHLKGAAVGSR
ncbi:MAG: dienelactone hydrolase family protein [Chloroflexi bacterium]|nr:dienelactone hydrolase family protein [Chloroflexota bacterium]